MRRNAVWILVIGLACVVLFLFRSRSPFGKNNTSFAAPSDKEITRIELSGNDRKLIIELSNGKWLLNGKSEVRRNAAMLITKVVRELKIKSPVSPEMFDTVIASGNLKPVRVKVYEKRKLLTSFFVYKTSSNVYGNIMKTGEKSKPFIVYVPGFDGNIGNVFTLNELYWQPYTIFNLLPSEIASIDFRNPTEDDASFSIKNRGDSCVLTDGTNELQGCDPSTVKRYLSYFTFLPFESWALDLSPEDKMRIISQTPSYEITVTRPEGSQIRLTLWKKLNDKGEIDSDRLYGKTDASNEIFIIRYFDIDPLLKRREYFFGNKGMK